MKAALNRAVCAAMRMSERSHVGDERCDVFLRCEGRFDLARLFATGCRAVSPEIETRAEATTRTGENDDAYRRVVGKTVEGVVQ